MNKMIIRNLTRNAVISENAKFVDNAISQSLGLMFSKKQNKSLIFRFSREKMISLHMFFVFYPIDVIFLDKNKIVVDKKESFRPFTFYKSRKKAMYAIELPDGAIRKTKTKTGDKIGF